MKKVFKKAIILTFGFGMVLGFTACHSGSDESAPEVTTSISPKHAIRGIILDGDGKVLTGATVSLSRQGSASTRLVSVSNNVFEATGLTDGTWEVLVTKNGYKSASETFSLAVTTQTIEGKNVRAGQNVDQVFYLSKEVKSTAVKLGGTASASDEIVIETSTQDDGTGNIVNTTDPNGDQTKANEITVQVETPSISGSDYDDLSAQLTQQGGSIDDFSIFLVNINSLEDAKKLAEENNVSGARLMTRSTTALPGGYELMAGVGVDAGPFVLQLPGDTYYTVTITLPDNNTKKSVVLFRTITGDSWSPLTIGNGVVDVDRKQDNQIVIKLNILQTQSFAVGVKINETAGAVEYENITAEPIENTTSSVRSISTMPYIAKDGVVLANTIEGSLTDYLRKIVMRKYGTRAVSTPALVTKNYEFSPAYSLPANGTLYLVGYQTITNKIFSVVNADASFTAKEYGNTYVYPYATYPMPENTHVGGGN
jgi:hypothetical protein